MATLKLWVEKGGVGKNPKIWDKTAYIVVGRHLTHANQILLSTDCDNPEEVANYADDLIKQLENLKKRAKKMRWNNRRQSN